METERERATAGAGYLEQLTATDLDLLERVAGRPLRGHPELVEVTLRRPDAAAAVLPGDGREGAGGPSAGLAGLTAVSPFLVFAVAVQRTVEDLEGRRFVDEWLGPRQRVPVFGVGDLVEFASQPMLRLFLTEVLASYTHVASGSVWTRTSRGWRRRRWSELDPIRLASLLEVVPEAERPGLYRRLGDLALFLTGVFPDHTATYPLGPFGAARLLRAAPGGPGTGPAPGQAGEAAPAGVEAFPGALGTPGAVALFEELGRRWYRLAAAGAPVATGTVRVLDQVASRFDRARRLLNLVTDRYLFPFRDRWFPAPR